MSKIRKLLFGGLVFLVLSPFFFVAYFGAVQKYTLADSLYSVVLGWATDTEWAKDYSERKFAKVNIGMTREEVRKIMGEPIPQSNSDYWAHTWSPSSTHYHLRGIMFSPSGHVTEIVRGFYFD